MAALLVKRRMWIGFGLLALVLALTALASTIARNHIASPELAKALEDLTGRRVVLKNPPVIRMFPALTAELSNVSFHNWGYTGDSFPVLTAPVMRLTFSVFAALQGETRVTSATLEQPVFRAVAEDGTWQTPFSNQATFSKLIGEVILALPEMLNTKMFANIQNNMPGIIAVNDGSIVLDRASNDIVQNVNGQLNWMHGNKGGSLKAEGVWQSEVTSIRLTTDDAVLLVAGASTGLTATLESKFINSRFSGTARLLPSPYFEGDFFGQTNSLASILKWQKIASPVGIDGPKLTISGALKADAAKWQLEDSKLLLGSNRGSGVLTFLPLASPRSISGTVDFDVLDLAMMEPIFVADLSQNTQDSAKPLSVDLRISAGSASFGTLALSDVAASIQLSPEASALDINDASVFGGTLQLALKRQIGNASNNFHPQSELRVLADNMDTKKLGALDIFMGSLPEARGTLSAILRGPQKEGESFLKNAEGTVKLRLSEGRIPRIDGMALIKKLRLGGFVALNTKLPSSLAFTELNAEANLVSGTLQINPLRIGLSDALVELSGAFALEDRSVALTGKVQLEPGHPEASKGAEIIRIFIGGNSDAPLISALPSDARLVNP